MGADEENGQLWEKMLFTLDLKTLLQIVSRQQQYGLLQAEIASERLHFHGTRQRMRTTIRLVHGSIQTCTIGLKNGGVLAEGPQAVKLLLDAGVLEWDWQTGNVPFPNQMREESPAPQPGMTVTGDTSSTSPATLIPFRTLHSEEVLTTLPRDYRRVLALVDGQRSVHKIAVILSMSDEDVMKSLHTLQSHGLLES